MAGPSCGRLRCQQQRGRCKDKGSALVVCLLRMLDWAGGWGTQLGEDSLGGFESFWIKTFLFAWMHPTEVFGVQHYH